MNIRPASESDLSIISLCHISAFPKSLSSALGRRYVTKMLGWYLSSVDTFLFLMENSNMVIGYCGGMIKDGKRLVGSASSMAQFSFTQAELSFSTRPWLIFHSELRAKYKFIQSNIWRKIASLFLKRKRNSIRINSSDTYVALVVIGLSSQYQGKGMELCY